MSETDELLRPTFPVVGNCLPSDLTRAKNLCPAARDGKADPWIFCVEGTQYLQRISIWGSYDSTNTFDESEREGQSLARQLDTWWDEIKDSVRPHTNGNPTNAIFLRFIFNAYLRSKWALI
jgi:hypothetical protein